MRIGEERRRRRLAGDPRRSPEGGELFRRLTTCDLVTDLQADLDVVMAGYPLLNGDNNQNPSND